MRDIEIWKVIPRFSGVYEISSYGNLRSNDRVVDSSYITKAGTIAIRRTKVKGRHILAKPDRTGYVKHTSAFRGAKVSINLHREVATLFCEGYEEGMVVDHKDDNKSNNYASNLQWVTAGYNVSKSHPKHLGKKAAAYTGKVLAYDKDTGELLHTLRGSRDMKEKGFDYRNVSAVLMGKRNYHNGCIFVKVPDKREPKKITDCFTKSNFKRLNVVNVEEIVVDCINTYEELLDKGFTFQKVQRVLLGLEVSHRGYTFQIIEEK